MIVNLTHDQIHQIFKDADFYVTLTGKQFIGLESADRTFLHCIMAFILSDKDFIEVETIYTFAKKDEKEATNYVDKHWIPMFNYLIDIGIKMRLTLRIYASQLTDEEHRKLEAFGFIQAKVYDFPMETRIGTPKSVKDV